MAVNDKILKADYNTIRNKVTGVLGSGSANSGYGQPVRSSEVTESNRVTVNEWGNLYFDIVNCYVHQTGSAPPSPSSAVENATVRFDPTTSPNSQYDTFANTIVTNKFNIAGSQSFTTAKATAYQTWPGPYGNFWTSKVECYATVTFSSASQARYFFNSGSELRFTSSRSGGTASPTNSANVGWRQNESWTNFLATVNPTFGGNKPGTGVDPNDGTNFYRLSNTYQVFYSVSASSPYGSNIFRVSARSPSVADNSAGTASVIEFYFEWIDNYTDPVPGGGLPASSFPPGDGVDGTISIFCTTLEATGVLVPAGTGNFRVESPTVDFSVLSSSSSAPATPPAPEAPTESTPPPFVPGFATSISPTSGSQSTPFALPQTTGNTFSTTFVVSCSSGSGTVFITSTPFASFAECSCSPQSFPLSAGQTRTVTFSGSAPPTSITNPWTFTASLNTGGTYTYTINRV